MQPVPLPLVRIGRKVPCLGNQCIHSHCSHGLGLLFHLENSQYGLFGRSGGRCCDYYNYRCHQYGRSRDGDGNCCGGSGRGGQLFMGRTVPGNLLLSQCDESD